MALAFHAVYRMKSSAIESARREYSLPPGRVIYSDLNGPAKPLFSRQFGISGKPDFIVKDKDNALIPVELKSGRTDKPHRGHILQLAAYCLLIEETYGKTVPHGILVYGDGKQHLIKFDNDLRAGLLSAVEDMRRCWSDGHPERMHNSKRRCISCLLREDCSYSLA